MTVAAAGSFREIGDASVMDADAVAAALHVDVENGLSSQEAARRLAQDGPNELRAAHTRNVLQPAERRRPRARDERGGRADGGGDLRAGLNGSRDGAEEVSPRRTRPAREGCM